jgi:type II secretory pathway pseudopilin PulG
MTIPTARRGITLMEVLISIGILAIGLTSVVSLVPAGQSQAARAVVLDRAATAAANGLADAVTFGFTRADSVILSGTSVATPGSVSILDPAILRIEAEQGLAKWPNASYPNAAGAAIKPTGVYSPNGLAPAAPWQTARLFGQGRDDVVATAGSGADDPPVNVQTSGVRAFQGRMTSLFSLALADNVSNSRAPTAGDVAKLTVVVFHNRARADEAGLTVPAVFDDVTQSLSMNVTDIPSGRTFNEIIRPGVVIYDPSKTPAGEQYQRWSQVLMASVDDSPKGGAIRAFVTFASPRPNSGTVRVLLDSVGMAEQMIVVEGSSGYTR